MKWFSPKVILEWREPKAVCWWHFEREKQDLKSQLNPWTMAFVIFVMAGILVFVWERFDLGNDPPLMDILLKFLAGAIFFAYGFPWMSLWLFSFLPNYIRLYNEHIVRTVGNTNTLIKVRDIIDCEISSVMIENEGSFPLLLIKTAKRKTPFAIGIPPEMLSQVSDALASLGVKVGRRRPA